MNNKEKETKLQELIRRKARKRAMNDYQEFKDILSKNIFAQRLKCKENGHPLWRALDNDWYDILKPLTIQDTINELIEYYIAEETEEIFKRIEFIRNKGE